MPVNIQDINALPDFDPAEVKGNSVKSKSANNGVADIDLPDFDPAEVKTAKRDTRSKPMTSVVNGTDPELARKNADYVRMAVTKYAGEDYAKSTGPNTVVIPNKSGATIYESDDQGAAISTVDKANQSIRTETIRFDKSGASKSAEVYNKADDLPEIIDANTRALSAPALKKAQDLALEEVNANKSYISDFFNNYKDKMGDMLIMDVGSEAEKRNAPQRVSTLGSISRGTLPFSDPMQMQSVSQNVKTQGVFSKENFLNRIMNTNGDTRALSQFVDMSMRMLDGEKAKELEDLKSKFTVTDVNVGGVNVNLGKVPYENEQFFKEQKLIEDKYADTKENLQQAVSSMAALKSVNKKIAEVGAGNISKIDPLQIGMEVALQTGYGDKVNKDKTKLQRGQKIAPDDRVAYKQMGYQALQYAMYDQASQDRQPVVKELSQKVKDYRTKILSEEPEFVKEKKVQAISAQIYKDENALLSSLIDNDPTQEDIIAAGKKLNIDVSGIKPEDIQNPKVWYKRAVGSFIENSAGGLYKLGMRGVANAYEGLGGNVDWEAFNQHYDHDWYNNNSTFLFGGQTLMGQTPQGSTLFGEGGTVNTDPESNNYLGDQANPHAGKFNWDVRAILNQIGEGAGQIAAFGYTGSKLGQVYTGARIARMGENAATVLNDAAKISKLYSQGQRVGTALSTFATQYADNYTDALEVLGDAPGDEGKRNLYATAKTASSALTEMILPDAKIVDNLLGPGTASGRELISLIRANGIKALETKPVQQIIARGLKEGIIDWQKEISEDVLDELGGQITDALLAPKKYQSTDYTEQMKQTYITSAISSFLPTVGGAMNNYRDRSKMKKAMVFEVGNNPDIYVDDINQQVSDGKIEQKEANEKISIINTLADIVDKKLPSGNIEGKPLTPSQKIDYTHNLMSEALLNAHKKNLTDPVQVEQIDQQIADLQEQRKYLLAPVVTPMDVITGKPIDDPNTVSPIINTQTNEGENQQRGENGDTQQAEIRTENDQPQLSGREASQGINQEERIPLTPVSGVSTTGNSVDYSANPFGFVDEDENGNVLPPPPPIDLNPNSAPPATLSAGEQLTPPQQQEQTATENVVPVNTVANEAVQQVEAAVQKENGETLPKTAENIELARQAELNSISDFKEPVQEGKIMYIKTADGNGFNTDMLSEQSDNKKIYEIAITGDNTATYKVTSNREPQLFALEDPRNYLAVANYLVPPSSANDTIVTNELGQLEKVGNKWQIVKPTKITFVAPGETFKDDSATKAINEKYDAELKNLNVTNVNESLPSRFSQEEEAGVKLGGDILSQAISSLKKDSDVESFAKDQGYWQGDLQEKYGEYNDKGDEAIVWIDKNMKEVIKAILPVSQGNDMSYLMDEIVYHNTVFPNTAIKVIGFGTYGDDRVRVVVQQPFVEGVPMYKSDKKSALYDYMSEHGFKPVSENKIMSAAFTNGRIYVSDLSGKNVLIGKDGELKVIDATYSRIDNENTLPPPKIKTVDDGELYEFRVPEGLIAGVRLSPTEFRIDGISAATVGQGNGTRLFEGLINYLREKGVTTLSTISAGEGAQKMHQKAVEKGLLTEMAKDGRTATFAINGAENANNSISEDKPVENINNNEGQKVEDIGNQSILDQIREMPFAQRRERALRNDPSSFEESVLQFLLRMGRVKTEDFVRLTGYKGRDLQMYGRRVSPKGESIDQWVHDQNGSFGITDDNEFKRQQEMVDIILAHPGQVSVVDRLEDIDPENHEDQNSWEMGAVDDAIDMPQWEASAWVNEQVSWDENQQLENNPEAQLTIDSLDDAIDKLQLSDEQLEGISNYLQQHLDTEGNINWQGLQNDILNGAKIFEELGDNPVRFLNRIADEYVPFSNNDEQSQVLRETEKLVQNNTSNDEQSQAIGANTASENQPQSTQQTGPGNNISQGTNEEDNSSQTGTEQQPGSSDLQGLGSNTVENLNPPPLKKPELTGDELQDAVNEYNWLNHVVSTKENKISRMEEKGQQPTEEYKKAKESLSVYSKKLSDAIRKLKIKNNGLALTTPAQIPVALWNAAVETVALAVQAGELLRNAIDRGVDYINQRQVTEWDDSKFREALGYEDQLERTPEDIRQQKISKIKLSIPNQQAAMTLITAVKDNRESLNSVLNIVSAAKGVSDNIKEKIKSYISEYVNAHYKEEGYGWADNYLSQTNNNYNEALALLEEDAATRIMGAFDERDLENQKHIYAAAKQRIGSLRTAAGVLDRSIQPSPSVDNGDNGEKFGLPARTAKDKVQENTQDRYARLVTAQKQSIVPITERLDAVQAKRLAKSLSHYLIDQIWDYIGNKEKKAGTFYDRLNKAGLDVYKLGLYQYAMHARERNEYNALNRQRLFDAKLYELETELAFADDPAKGKRIENRIDELYKQKDPRFELLPDGGSGMTNKQADEILKAIDDEGQRDKYESFAKEFRENVIDKLLDYKYDSGLIDVGDYNHLKTFYKNYVPLKVDMSEEEENSRDRRFFKSTGLSGRDIYKSRGSVDRTFDQRNNPMLQSIVDLETTIQKSVDNKANLVLANLVRNNPNENIWKVSVARFESVRDKDGNVYRMNEVDRPQYAITFYEDGVKKYVNLYDKGLQNMIKQVGSKEMQRWISLPTRILTAVNTLYNPEFLIKNAFYDLGDAYLSTLGDANKEISKKFKKYAVRAPGVLAKMLFGNKSNEWNKWVDEWKSHGGEISFLNQVSIDDEATKSLKLFDSYGKRFSAQDVKQALKSVQKIQSAIEQMTRVMVYRAAVESGIEPKKAANISRNATLDFEKKGVYGTYINAFKAFANAGIQGATNVAYLAYKSKRVRWFLGAMVLSGIAEALVNDLAGDCDPETNPTLEGCWWEIPEYQKQRSFIIPTGPGNTSISMPIGRQFAWFNYLGKNLYGIVRGKVPAGDFVSHTIGSLLDFYNPAGGDAPIEQKLVGNLAPLIALKTNKNTFGSAITPDRNDIPQHENYWPKTEKGYVEATNYLSTLTGGGPSKEGKIEISPDELKFVMQSAFGGVYNFIIDGAKDVNALSKGEDIKMKEVPFLRIFARESEMAITKSRYYELVNKSKNNLVNEDEIKDFNQYGDAMVNGGVISKDTWDERKDWFEKNQERLERRAEKEE